MSDISVWITPIAGFLLGAALVRANSCTVASTRRLVIERRADWLLGLLVAISWAGVVLHSFAFLTPIDLKFPTDLPITTFLVAGGILLGLGALLNKGCFLGSVSQLCRGNLNYLLTLAGIALALSTFSYAPNIFSETRSQGNGGAMSALHFSWLSMLTVLIFCLMIIFSLIKLYRRQTMTLMALIIVGISGGVIYAFNPDWSYTSVLDRAVNGALTSQTWPLEVGAVSMFAGAILSSIIGSKFTIIALSYNDAFSCLVGGFLMGIGAKLIPGGNDALMLWSIPGLTSYGLISYSIMILTIALGFAILRRITSPNHNVPKEQKL